MRRLLLLILATQFYLLIMASTGVGNANKVFFHILNPALSFIVAYYVFRVSSDMTKKLDNKVELSTTAIANLLESQFWYMELAKTKDARDKASVNLHVSEDTAKLIGEDHTLNLKAMQSNLDRITELEVGARDNVDMTRREAWSSLKKLSDMSSNISVKMPNLDLPDSKINIYNLRTDRVILTYVIDILQKLNDKEDEDEQT